jgi:hypothetical protein
MTQPPRAKIRKRAPSVTHDEKTPYVDGKLIQTVRATPTESIEPAESNVVGISHGQVYHDQPLEYEAPTPRVPAWLWVVGIAAPIAGLASYGAQFVAR